MALFTFTKKLSMNASSSTPLVPLHVHIENKDHPTHPLFMLHGWGQSLDMLLPLGKLLAKRSPTYLLDLPGFGKSGLPDAVWSSFDYADRLVAYMDENHIDQADFLGHSFGGKIALSFAIRYPQRIRRLVVIAASGLPRQRTLLEKCRRQTIRWMGKGIKKFDHLASSDYYTSYFSQRFGSADYRQAGKMRPILVRSVNEDLSPCIPQIRAPTLLIWGEQDTETPPEMAHRMHNLIPSSTILLLPHKGHMPFQDVGAHLCAYHIMPFLSSPDALRMPEKTP